MIPMAAKKRAFAIYGRIIFVSVLLVFILADSLSGTEKPPPLPINPFGLEKCRPAPGTTFEIAIDEDLFSENKAFAGMKIFQFVEGIK